MKPSEINEKLYRLSWLRDQLEAMYMENEGEVTEETEQIEEEIGIIQSLLDEEPDELGRYLVSLEDSVARFKAEENAIAARRKRLESYMEFVRATARKLVVAQEGRTEIKGQLYKFKATKSVKTKPNADAINEEYLEPIKKALEPLGLPTWLIVDIDASVTIAKGEGPLEERFFTVTESEALSFTKPRKTK